MLQTLRELSGLTESFMGVATIASTTLIALASPLSWPMVAIAFSGATAGADMIKEGGEIFHRPPSEEEIAERQDAIRRQHKREEARKTRKPQKPKEPAEPDYSFHPPTADVTANRIP